jgi:undecaprenyl-diphosphatase
VETGPRAASDGAGGSLGPRSADPNRARPATAGERRRLWLLFAGNGRYRPSGFAPTYRERLDEGLLDLRLVDGATRFAKGRLIVAVLTGQLRRSRVYEQRTAVRIQVRATGAGRAGARPARPLPFARDGEVTESVRDVTITPGGARLVVYRPR